MQRLTIFSDFMQLETYICIFYPILYHKIDRRKCHTLGPLNVRKGYVAAELWPLLYAVHRYYNSKTVLPLDKYRHALHSAVASQGHDRHVLDGEPPLVKINCHRRGRSRAGGDGCALGMKRAAAIRL